jgi:diaminopimelate decarboxylase
VKRDYPFLAPARLDEAPAAQPVSVVGPLCTPLDTLARKASLPSLRSGDLLAILQSGAYGPTASPNGFLSHDRPAEVLVDGADVRPLGH